MKEKGTPAGFALGNATGDGLWCNWLVWSHGGMLVDKDNKARRRPVKTGLVTDTGIAIIDGLAGTERIVLRAGGFLQPDEAVQPRAATK